MKYSKIRDIATNYNNRILSNKNWAYNLLKYKEHVIVILTI